MGNFAENLNLGNRFRPPCFDQLIPTTPSTAASSSYKRTVLSGQGCQSEEAASLAVKCN